MTSVVQFSEQYVRNAAGIELYMRQYFPSQEFKQVIVFVHGASEHCGRYHSFFCDAVAKGFGVVAFDLYGHGRSHGVRHDCLSFEEYVENVHTIADAARAALDTSPREYILVGTSLGGLIAAHVVCIAKHKWHGLVLLAPAIGVEFNWILSIQSTLASTLVLVIPTWNIVPAAPAHEISRDPNVIQNFLNDPLNQHGNIKMRLAWAILEGMKSLDPSALDIPLLIMHGDHDKITSAKFSQEFFTKVKSLIKDFHLLPGQYHELLNEPEKKENGEMIFQWISKL